MKILAWVGVGVVISALFLSYMVYMPIYYRFNQTFTERTNLTAEGKATSEKIANTAQTQIRTVLYLFTGLFILYGLASMQSSERVTQGGPIY